MPERVHELKRRAPDPIPDTTAPVDVKLRSVALVVIATASAVGLLYWAREVFIPIVLSVLISYALEPIVALLIRIRLPAAAGRGYGHEPLHRRRVLRLLPARLGRSREAEAGEPCRTVVREEEDHGADSQRDRRADRALPRPARRHERRRRHCDVAGVPVDGRASRGDVGRGGRRA